MARLIVITGVTRGLGRALTDGFITAGHTVVGCGRSTTDIADLQQEYPTPHYFTALDVTDAKQVDVWARRLLSSHGVPDLLVNNAAIINRNAVLWELSAEEFDRVIDVNIKGVVNVIRAIAPSMVAKKSGVIVNLSSGWGRSTSPEVAPYCATKYAIEGLTLSLAQELPRGMAAIPLNPGVIDTDLLRSCFGSSASHYPDAATWATRAVPFLLRLGSKDNGRSLTVP